MWVQGQPQRTLQTQQKDKTYKISISSHTCGYAAIVGLRCKFLFGKETVWNTNKVELLTLKGNMHRRKTGRHRLHKAAWAQTFPSVSVKPQHESGRSASLQTASRSGNRCYQRSAGEHTVCAQVHRPFQTQHCCWDCCSAVRTPQTCSTKTEPDFKKTN